MADIFPEITDPNTRAALNLPPLGSEGGSDGFDWGNIFSTKNLVQNGLPLLGAWLASNSNSDFFTGETPKTGYQGSIPDYTAVRSAVPGTYDPNRRPGSGGQRYFSDLQYVPSSDAAGIEAAFASTGQQAQQLGTANADNPAKQQRTSLDWYLNPSELAGLYAVLDNADWSDSEKVAQIVGAMNKYNVTPFMLSEATGVPVARINAAIADFNSGALDGMSSGQQSEQQSSTQSSSIAAEDARYSPQKKIVAKDDADYFTQLLNSSNLSSESVAAAQEYIAQNNVTPERVAELTGYDPEDVDSYFQASGIAPTAAQATAPKAAKLAPSTEATTLMGNTDNTDDVRDIMSLWDTYDTDGYDSFSDAFFDKYGMTWREYNGGPRLESEIPQFAGGTLGVEGNHPGQELLENLGQGGEALFDVPGVSPEDLAYLQKHGMEIPTYLSDADITAQKAEREAARRAEMMAQYAGAPEIDPYEQYLNYQDNGLDFNSVQPTPTGQPVVGGIDPDDYGALTAMYSQLATTPENEFLQGNIDDIVTRGGYTEEQLAPLKGWRSGSGYAGGGYIEGSGDGMADSLMTSIDGEQDAALSHGEFVIPADVVSHLGNGNSDRGAEILHAMMENVRKARTGTPRQGNEIDATRFVPGLR